MMEALHVQQQQRDQNAEEFGGHSYGNGKVTVAERPPSKDGSFPAVPMAL